MEYLKAAVSLRSLIKETNSVLLQKTDQIVDDPNHMRVKVDEDSTQNIVMEAFSDEFVNTTLNNFGDSIAFVMTDIACMNVKGQEMNYLLYKGYHSEIEKGMVFYQVIDMDTLKPQGALQFSNMEENIFYTIDAPAVEESSCNAMETDKKIENGKSIVFFIGHMDEERLTYDIQRLIFDTANNVTAHPKLNFNFTIHIARFGGSPSEELRAQVKAIEEFTRSHICPEYPNTTFQFSYEEDACASNE